jgi:hypothetical protein
MDDLNYWTEKLRQAEQDSMRRVRGPHWTTWLESDSAPRPS